MPPPSHDINEVCKQVFPILDEHPDYSLRKLCHAMKRSKVGASPISRAYMKWRRGERL